MASELLGVDDQRSPPVEETAEPTCNPGAAPGNVRYRWGDAAIDSVSSFGVPVRSRPTAALRRVDAAVVVDAIAVVPSRRASFFARVARAVETQGLHPGGEKCASARRRRS